MTSRTRASISAGSSPSPITLAVSFGSERAAGGKSHSWVTATTESPSPRANSASVAEGTRLAILTPVRIGFEIRWQSCFQTRRSGRGLHGSRAGAATGDAITKKFDNDDFVGSVEFVRRLTGPAEEMGHHPDLEISWSETTVSITNHSAGGLTEADFELASRIDALD